MWFLILTVYLGQPVSTHVGPFLTEEECTRVATRHVISIGQGGLPVHVQCEMRL
jgi:hypothetical protein